MLHARCEIFGKQHVGPRLTCGWLHTGMQTKFLPDFDSCVGTGRDGMSCSGSRAGEPGRIGAAAHVFASV